MLIYKKKFICSVMEIGVTYHVGPSRDTHVKTSISIYPIIKIIVFYYSIFPHRMNDELGLEGPRC